MYVDMADGVKKREQEREWGVDMAKILCRYNEKKINSENPLPKNGFRVV